MRYGNVFLWLVTVIDTQLRTASIETIGYILVSNNVMQLAPSIHKTELCNSGRGTSHQPLVQSILVLCYVWDPLKY